MKERRIIFSAPMVRAIMDGRKSQTRRIVKHASPDLIDTDGWPLIDLSDRGAGEVRAKCPYGEPGDRLWVRETFGFVAPPPENWAPNKECNIEYRADLPEGCTDQPGEWPAEYARGDPEAPKWRASIHMPRWASRILLDVVSVRVKRLQDISEDDAQAEGTPHSLNLPAGRTAVDNYAHLWQCINGDESWQANPWVWVVEFKVVTMVESQ